MKNQHPVRSILASMLFSVALSQPLASHAAVWTVTSLADSGAGSLRDAVQLSGSGDVIQFSVNGTIALTTGVPITIDHTLWVRGPGPSKLAVSGSSAGRVFYVTNGNPAVLSGMTIRDGLFVASPGTDGGLCQDGGGGIPAVAGGVWAFNHVIISNCWFTGNTARGGHGGHGGNNPTMGAACPGGKGGDGGDAFGGALYASGITIIINSTFSDNHAIGGQGGAGGSVSGFAGNASGNGGKGGHAKGGAVDLSTGQSSVLLNCTFSGNSTVGGGGGDGGNNDPIFVAGNGGDGGDGECGAAAIGVNLIKSSTIVSNSAAGGLQGAFGLPGGLPGIPGAGYTGGICGPIVGCAVQMGNTIVADNFASTARSNIYLEVVDLGFNFIGDDDFFSFCGGASGTGTRVGTVASPLHSHLAALAQNGGGMPTHAPLPPSPVIDTGHSLGLTTDERRAPRPFGNPAIAGGDGSDVGAFEFGSTPLGMGKGGTNGGQVIVTWPASYGDFSLQSTSNLLSPAGWTSVTDAPALVGDSFVVTNTPSGTSRFYRLIHN
jgi:hypothetical protein